MSLCGVSGTGRTSPVSPISPKSTESPGTGCLESLQYGMGYVIGTDGLTVRTDVIDFYDSEGTGPEDWVEGIDAGALLEPRSLYEDQLRRRLAGRGPY